MQTGKRRKTILVSSAEHENTMHHMCKKARDTQELSDNRDEDEDEASLCTMFGLELNER